jgi:hypothetical protein
MSGPSIVAESFSPESEQIEYGVHSMIINHEARKVRVFTASDATDAEIPLDWIAVDAKLAELGVETLSEVPEEQYDGILCAGGAF